MTGPFVQLRGRLLAVCLSLGVFDLIIGFNLLWPGGVPRDAADYKVLFDFLPETLWGLGWIVGGFTTLAVIRWPKMNYFRLAFYIGAIFDVFWAVGEFLAGGIKRQGLINPAHWMLLAAFRISLAVARDLPVQVAGRRAARTAGDTPKDTPRDGG